MSRRFHFLAVTITLVAGSFVHAAENVATDIHVGYDYATKVLTEAKKECKAVRRTIEQEDGSSFVDCLSKNEKNTIRYRITPKTSSTPTVELVARKPVAPSLGPT